ncbi:MAG TPA: hypothetical protein VN650_05205 [Gemmatimonadaceae bacterium]|nr:hypothetical protein [Gemmatimonadaceae bacterium]
MPDHIHAIVVLCRVPATTLTTQSVTSRGSSPREIALPDIVRHIESLTTARYRHAVTDHGWSRFSGPLSQRNSYACIIRNDRALANIRRYIRANPSNWIETPRWR